MSWENLSLKHRCKLRKVRNLSAFVQASQAKLAQSLNVSVLFQKKDFPSYSLSMVHIVSRSNVHRCRYRYEYMKEFNNKMVCIPEIHSCTANSKYIDIDYPSTLLSNPFAFKSNHKIE